MTYGDNFLAITKEIERLDPSLKAWVEGGGAAVPYISVRVNDDLSFGFSHDDELSGSWYGIRYDKDGNVNPMNGDTDGFELNAKPFDSETFVAETIVKWVKEYR